MEMWQLTIIVLAAVLVGALLPVLFMLTAMLAAVRKRVLENGTQLDDTLNRIHTVSTRLETASRGLEGGEEDIARLVDAAGSLSERLMQAESSVKKAVSIGNAVGPVVAAFIEGLRRPPGSQDATEPLAKEPPRE